MSNDRVSGSKGAASSGQTGATGEQKGVILREKIARLIEVIDGTGDEEINFHVSEERLFGLDQVKLTRRPDGNGETVLFVSVWTKDSRTATGYFYSWAEVLDFLAETLATQPRRTPISNRLVDILVTDEDYNSDNPTPLFPRL